MRAATDQPAHHRTRLRPWARRVVTVVGLVPVWLLAQMGVALAGDGGKVGQTPAALSWIKLVDSRGNSVWNYELSLDRGGVTSPGKVIWSFVIDLFWQLYRGGVVIAIWFIDWALSFDWLPVVAGPVMKLSDNLTSLMQRFGATGLFVTIAAVVAVTWMMRGKWVLGLFELFTSLFIASLAAGVLASPVAMVAGQDGLLLGSRDFGLQVADGLATDGGTFNTDVDPDALRKANTARMVDTFVRLPLQTLNFGQPLDGTKCQGAYDEVIAAGPYGEDSDIRDAVNDCDNNLGEVAANPSSGQAMSAVIIGPAAFFLLLFASVLSGSVFLAALAALYQGLKAIVTLVTGLLPGAARGALWQTLADLTMALVTLVFSIVFTACYLLLIVGALTPGNPDESPMQTFFFVDVLLLVALILFWRARKSLKKASGRLAQILASRPGAGPTSLPAKPARFDPASAYYKARVASGLAAGAGQAAGALAGPARRVGNAYASGRDRAAGAVAGWSQRLRPTAGPGRTATSPSGSTFGHPGSGPSSPPLGPALPGVGGGGGGAGGAPGRLTARLAGRQPSSTGGLLRRFAGQVVVAAATGGSSTVLTAVAKAGTSAAIAAASSRALSGTRPTRALTAGPTSHRTAIQGRLRPQLPPGPGPQRPVQPPPTRPAASEPSAAPRSPSTTPQPPGPRPHRPAGRPGHRGTPAAQPPQAGPTTARRAVPRPTVTRASGARPAAAPPAVAAPVVIDQTGKQLPEASQRLQELLATRRGQRPPGRLTG